MRVTELGLVGLAGCAFDWMLSRPWRNVLLCFLPMLIALCTVGLVGASSWLNRNTLADKYLQAANEEVTEWEKQWAGQAVEAAVASGQQAPKKIPAAAEMLFRRVQQLQENDARSVFFVALCYIQRGAIQQGLTMLNRIAPAERVGYAPAHAYLAEQILTRPLAPKDVPLARHHAQAALGYRQISPALLSLISNFFAWANEPKLSIEAMKAAAKIDPKYYLLMAQLPIKEPIFKDELKEALGKAKQHFEEKLATTPGDTGVRLMLADALRAGNDFEGAERVLVEGMKFGQSQVLNAALAEIYRQVFAKTAVFKDDAWTGNIELLEKAYRLDPNNMFIFEEVAKLARVSGSVPNEQLMDQLRKNLAEGKATSVTHMWIAEHYLNTNQYPKAIPHLEQAVNRDPNSSRNWNNLAYCLADVDPSRSAEALQHVDRAIALAPRIPDYHDTRGTILMKMGRAGEAVTAFERAIEAVRNSKGAFAPQPAYHERLAEAYAAAGDSAMAGTHRQFAADLKQAIEKAKEIAPPNPAP